MSTIDRISSSTVSTADLASEVSAPARALTAKVDVTGVSADVAPMLGGLLRGLEAFERPGPQTIVPRPPGGVEPERALGAMTRASSRLKSELSAAQVSPQTQRIQQMLDVIDEHLALKREVLVRAGTDG